MSMYHLYDLLSCCLQNEKIVIKLLISRNASIQYNANLQYVGRQNIQEESPRSFSHKMDTIMISRDLSTDSMMIRAEQPGDRSVSAQFRQIGH